MRKGCIWSDGTDSQAEAWSRVNLGVYSQYWIAVKDPIANSGLNHARVEWFLTSNAIGNVDDPALPIKPSAPNKPQVAVDQACLSQCTYEVDRVAVIGNLTRTKSMRNKQTENYHSQYHFNHREPRMSVYLYIVITCATIN